MRLTRRSEHRFHLATVRTARAAYVALILVATVVEAVSHPQLAGAVARFRYALEPRLSWGDAYDALRNVLLFSGLGATWLVTSPPTRLRDAVWRATVVGFVLSASVEFVQIFSARRVASIADVTTNTTGAFLGALAAGLLVAAVRARRGHRTTLGIPFFLFAIAQFGAVLAERLAPRFDVSVLSGAHGDPLQRLAFTWHAASPMAITHLALGGIVLAIPAGAFAYVAWIELGAKRSRALAWTSLGGMALTLLVEVAHGGVGMPVDLAAAAASGVGVIVGALLAATLEARLHPMEGVTRARIVAVTTLASTVLWSWRPFIPRTSADAMAAALGRTVWLPIHAHPYTANLLGVAQVLQLAALGFSLGALLAVWPLRVKGVLGYVWPAALFAAFIELGHAALAAREVDITGFLLLFAGAWLGDAVVRRAGFRQYGTLLG